MGVSITGWSHSKFGKSEHSSVEALIASVSKAALVDAKIEATDVDAIFLGAFNNGFGRQDFQASLVSLAIPELRYVPATRVENACATGSAAIHAGMNAIRAGRAKRVLVIGAEKMTAISTPQVGDVLLSACYVDEEAEVDGGFAGIFANVAKSYFQKYGDKSDSLAKIAAKNHANGVHNPYAHMQKDFGFEFCNTISDKNPMVVDPLRRTDCSLISDGAAALVLTDTDVAIQDGSKAVSLRAAEQVNDFLPMSKRSHTAFDGAKRAWHQALDAAELTLLDLSLVETHDCFTIAELLEYEAMGLADEGQGHRVIEDGLSSMDGKLPINPSGGLKAKGHPIGATGVSQHVMAAMQLVGDAGDMQLKDPAFAGVFNMGGLAVANYVSILERIR
ncbi:MAG: acetyl-CoA acetyltransferase [Pseudomonadota bacterium]